MATKKKPNPVIEFLYEAMASEFEALSQYMDHHSRLDDQGYTQLATTMEDQALEEMKHAESIMRRILFLGGPLDYGPHGVPETVDDPEKILLSNMRLEKMAIEIYNRGIEVCRKAGDNGTRVMLEGILADEEKHKDQLDEYLGLLKAHGKEFFLIKG